MGETTVIRVLTALLVPLCCLALAGCYNECQQLCNEMGEYWQDCSLDFGDEEVKECRESFRGGVGSEEAPTLYGQYKATCTQLIATEEAEDGQRTSSLRVRFSCDDMRDGPGGAFGDVTN